MRELYPRLQPMMNLVLYGDFGQGHPLEVLSGIVTSQSVRKYYDSQILVPECCLTSYSCVTLGICIGLNVMQIVTATM